MKLIYLVFCSYLMVTREGSADTSQPTHSPPFLGKWNSSCHLRRRYSGQEGLHSTTFFSDFLVAASDTTGLKYQHNPFVYSVWFKRLIFLPLSHITANPSRDIALLLIIPLVVEISRGSCHCLSKHWINISVSYCAFSGFPTSPGNCELLVENTKFESVRKVAFNPWKNFTVQYHAFVTFVMREKRVSRCVVNIKWKSRMHVCFKCNEKALHLRLLY